MHDRPKRLLNMLQKTFAIPEWTPSGSDPFRTLIVTIISQNTADRNTARAFENLSDKFQITPEVLAKARKKEIEECLKVGGLYRTKAETIMEVSKSILERYKGNMESILSLPVEEARKTLMQFPGVGPKTADVVLLFTAKHNTIPVDTHVDRVSKRLGLAPMKGNYETVRNALQLIYDPGEYLKVHISFILQGRKYCRVRVPLCDECPINIFCPTRHLWDKND